MKFYRFSEALREDREQCEGELIGTMAKNPARLQFAGMLIKFLELERATMLEQGQLEQAKGMQTGISKLIAAANKAAGNT